MKRLLPILFCLLFAISASAYVYDFADLYTDEEEAQIFAEAETVYADSGILCVILTDHGIGNITDELPYYAGDALDMALLTIDMTAREFYLYQYNAVEGESAFRISAVESDSILDGILPEMADGEYFFAALTYLELTEDAFTNVEVFAPVETGKDYEYIEYPHYEYPDYEYPTEPKRFLWDVFGTAVLIGAIAGGIIVLLVFLSYKRKVHGEIYPLGEFADLALHERRDTYTHTTHTRVRVSDSSSSSGGHHRSGGGFGGGGGFRSSGGGARMGGRKF